MALCHVLNVYSRTVVKLLMPSVRRSNLISKIFLGGGLEGVWGGSLGLALHGDFLGLEANKKLPQFLIC